MKDFRHILEITLLNPVLFDWTKWFKFHESISPLYSYKKIEDIQFMGFVHCTLFRQCKGDDVLNKLSK